MLSLKVLVFIKQIQQLRRPLLKVQSPRQHQLLLQPLLPKQINPRGVAAYLISSLLRGAVVRQRLQDRSHLKSH